MESSHLVLYDSDSFLDEKKEPEATVGTQRTKNSHIIDSIEETIKKNMPPYTDNHSHCSGDGPSSPSSSSRPLHHRAQLTKTTSNVETRDELLQLAAAELDAMRRPSSPPSFRRDERGSIGSLPSTCTHGPSVSSGGDSNNSSPSNSGGGERRDEAERSFPPACLHLLHALPGNSRCHDCSSTSATWASVSYGITLCLQCGGRHRGLGVGRSFVKSLTLDSWKRREILAMLEGGNVQLGNFFDRHGMGGGTSESGGGGKSEGGDGGVGGLDRYKTKAASFYRQHLMGHARELADRGGLYEGREASRSGKQQQQGGQKTKKKAEAGASSPGKSVRRKKPREAARSQREPKLPTVTEKDSVACGAIGA